MNLLDALSIIASSYNARTAEEQQVYNRARDIAEAHAEQVMARECGRMAPPTQTEYLEVASYYRYQPFQLQ
jgi:hypothetical protein